MVKNQIESYQNQYGKLISVNKIEDGINIIGEFFSEKISFSKQANFKTDQVIKSTFKNLAYALALFDPPASGAAIIKFSNFLDFKYGAKRVEA